MNEFKHIPVMLREAIDFLKIKSDGIYVDATLGGAGHSKEILKRIPEGHLYCFEQDSFAIEVSEKKLRQIGENFTIINANFKDMKAKFSELGVHEIDGILYDLGVSSFQLDIAERGFSYHLDAPLDMRMDLTNPKSATDVVNSYSYDDLKRIFYEYGEEKNAPLIARRIVSERQVKPITTTIELVEIIKKALPSKILRRVKHPARQVFQAIRIEVNNELTAFEDSVKQSCSLIKSGGRCVVITFHSLEDRICKREFQNLTEVKTPKGLPVRNEIEASFKIVTRKPVLPQVSEFRENPRSQSAKMRVIEKK